MDRNEINRCPDLARTVVLPVDAVIQESVEEFECAFCLLRSRATDPVGIGDALDRVYGIVPVTEEISVIAFFGTPCGVVVRFVPRLEVLGRHLVVAVPFGEMLDERLHERPPEIVIGGCGIVLLRVPEVRGHPLDLHDRLHIMLDEDVVYPIDVGPIIFEMIVLGEHTGGTFAAPVVVISFVEVVITPAVGREDVVHPDVGRLGWIRSEIRVHPPVLRRVRKVGVVVSHSAVKVRKWDSLF